MKNLLRSYTVTPTRVFGMLILSFALLVISLPHSLNAQCSGDIYLMSQTDVDNFNCTHVDGSLFIWGGEIENLDGLSELTRVEVNLEISGTVTMTNVNGLSRLTDVVRTLSITNNHPLWKSMGRLISRC